MADGHRYYDDNSNTVKFLNFMYFSSDNASRVFLQNNLIRQELQRPGDPLQEGIENLIFDSNNNVSRSSGRSYSVTWKCD